MEHNGSTVAHIQGSCPVCRQIGGLTAFTLLFSLPSKNRLIYKRGEVGVAEASSCPYLTDESKTFWPVRKDFLLRGGSQ